MSCQATCCSIVIPVTPSRDYPHHGDAARKIPLVAWVKAFMRWRERRRQRQCLLELDDHLLRDVGLTREQAVEEARKSFWITVY